MIARLDNASSRVFPTIQANLYHQKDPIGAQLTPDQQAARMLLLLANKDFSPWLKLRVRKLDIQRQIGHLLLQHRLAIESELASQWRRADFFWQQVQTELRIFTEEEKNWQAIVAALDIKHDAVVMRDAVQLRQRVINELFIDTHHAFYQGLLGNQESPSHTERALLHVSHIEKLLDLKMSDRSENDLNILIGLPRQQKVLSSLKQGDWQQAIQLCSGCLKYIPGSTVYQTELAEIYLSSVILKLSKFTQKSYELQSVQTLQTAINFFENLCKVYSSNLRIFELTSYLHYWHAIQRLKKKQLDESLLAAQKAITYNSCFGDAEEMRNSLLKQMLKSISEDTKSSSKASLDKAEKEHQLKVSRGIKLRDVYIQSPIAKTTLAAFQKALAGKAFLPSYPALAALDFCIEELRTFNLFKFINHQPLELPSVTFINTTSLIPSLRKSRHDRYPLLLWLFSQQSVGFRFQVFLIGFITLLIGGIVIQETSIGFSQSITYKKIQAADARADYDGVIQGAETFLSKVSLTGNKKEREEVIHLYSKAIVLQFWSQKSRLENMQHHFDRYRKIIDKVDK